MEKPIIIFMTDNYPKNFTPDFSIKDYVEMVREEDFKKAEIKTSEIITAWRKYKNENEI